MSSYRRKQQRIPRNPILRAHSFKRTTSFQLGVNSYQGFTTPSGASVYGNGLSFIYTLAGPIVTGSVAFATTVPMPNVSEFTSLFDQYKIKRIKVRMIWTNNVTNSSAAAGTLTGIANPIVQIATDLDDGVPPATNTSLMEREDTRFLAFDSTGPKSYSVTPKYAMAASIGGASATLGAQGSNWINVSSDTVQWFGTKLWMEPQSSGATQLQTGYLWLYFTYEYEFRTVR